MSKKRTVVCDIEADGLLHSVSQIWCIVCKDWDTGEIFKFTSDSTDEHRNLNEFTDWAKEEVHQWIGHNFIGYDMRVLKKILNCKIQPNRVTDTLVLSRLYDYARPGGHSLKAWGEWLGHTKGEYENWTKYTPDMLEYCVNDVELTYDVACSLKLEGKGKDGESVLIEHLTQHYLTEQEEFGFALDVPKAHTLFANLKNKADALETTILDVMPPLPIDEGMVEPKYKKDGDMSVVGLKFLGDDCLTLAVGPMSRISWEIFNLNSPVQKVKRLKPYWSPTIKTKSGNSWKLCEENLSTIFNDAPQELRDLGEFAMLTSRYKEIDGWLEALGKTDDRVHGTVFGIGAGTHRMSHNSPNTANIPTSGSPYGEECRSCFTVGNPATHVLLGCDAAGIQLRVLAHYMNDPEYTHEVVNGDIHTKNLEAMGIDKGTYDDEHKQWTARPIAKTFIYAWLLGAGDKKVGDIIGGNASDGRRTKERFLESLPALARFKKKAAQAAGLGGMVGIDGRWIGIKSEHYALSCYLQGGEAVIMKYAMLLWHNWVAQRKLDARQVAIVHDEFQIEVRKEHADEVGNLVKQSIIKAGEHFKLNCPMDANFNTGLNWAETH